MRILLSSLAGVAAALLIGALLGRFVSVTVAAWWLGIVFALFALVHTAYLSMLHHWSSLPRKRSLPAGLGPWSPILARLTRFARQEAEHRHELGSELERIHTAVDRLPDGLVVLDRYDHVLWANDSAEDLHGIFGTRRPIHHFIRQPEFARFLEAPDPSGAIRLQLPARPGRTYELRLHRTQGDQRLLITHDITDQAKLDAMRSDFVANVSHEIRTPVTVISGFAETLLTLDLDEGSKREYLNNILRQSQTMQRLVDDLLMLSSLENAAGQLEETQVDVHAMLGSLLAEAKALSNGRHSLQLALDGPRRVLAVPSELESAVRNLLTNAIRYTPEGGRIGIEWRIIDHEGWLTVRDTGIGIPPEHLPRLTERFYRVDRGRSRDSGGTGLGLAIIKRIMNRHGGKLNIESSLGTGSAFSLRLPTSRLVPDPMPRAVLDESQAALDESQSGEASLQAASNPEDGAASTVDAGTIEAPPVTDADGGTSLHRA
ncbi:MAG: phosphate regulon sensor histidine kinase PhoR [Burkholderiaceae bacterium]